MGADGTARQQLDFGGVAERLGVKVESVRVYKTNDPDFPEPCSAPGARPVKFDAEAIERYARLRETRNAGGRGRPPGTIGAEAGADDLASRIRAAVRTKQHDVQSLRELADLLGISSVGLGKKLKGTISWRPSELEVIAARLGVETDNAE